MQYYQQRNHRFMSQAGFMIHPWVSYWKEQRAIHHREIDHFEQINSC